MDEENKLSIEEAFQELDDVIRELSEPQTSLEDSFAAYKKGMDLVRECDEMIDRVEKQVQIMADGGELRDFSADADGED